MSSVLEAQRSALEELDRIESAISERISHNPGILPDNSQLSSGSELHGKKKRPYRETVLQEQEVGRFLKRYKEQCEFLDSSFSKVSDVKKKASNSDSNITEELIQSHPATLRQKELTSLATTGDARESVLDKFYDQIKQIKDYHRRYPNQEGEDLKSQYQMGIVGLHEKKQMLESGAFFTSSAQEGFSYDAEGNAIPSEDSEHQTAVKALMEAQNKGIYVLLSSMASDIDLDTVFSGEEFYGQYIDLVAFHERFVNLPFLKSDHVFSHVRKLSAEQLSYLNYLDVFASFSEKVYYPTARLRSEDYFSYVTQLHSYIESFFRKTHPLENIGKIISKIEKDFESSWEKKTPFPGWSFDNLDQESTEKPSIEDGVETPEGFYCTPCSKYFSKETVYKSHLGGKKHIKNAQQLNAASQSSKESSSTGNLSQIRLRLIAFHEYCIYNIAEILNKKIQATRNNVERRRALTDRERQLELESLESQNQFLLEEALSSLTAKRANGENADDDEEEDVTYNPLKLPIGWDGKPIPFWLWKLHGLGVQYSCEICGNHVYMGRKVFEKHFAEVRHVHGLRCLGVVPGALFNGITRIKDAMALWDKIKKENRVEEGRKENVVEMEDEEGNVMTEKVYNDLKKQGLL